MGGDQKEAVEIIEKLKGTFSFFAFYGKRKLECPLFNYMDGGYAVKEKETREKSNQA